MQLQRAAADECNLPGAQLSRDPPIDYSSWKPSRSGSTFVAGPGRAKISCAVPREVVLSTSSSNSHKMYAITTGSAAATRTEKLRWAAAKRRSNSSRPNGARPGAAGPLFES
eukprot:TRINITY_DN64849_c0_g1_i1.p1 TRINITY_DN64849_c0_g1~~TRINITY_DN64849_c0_g1_i1.p1  ORF type:complete len:112 (+),score=20.38 TRINITY_DN64849_c0_g1_i1:126-461(+)